MVLAGLVWMNVEILKMACSVAMAFRRSGLGRGMGSRWWPGAHMVSSKSGKQ